jgi:VWFA-related protein
MDLVASGTNLFAGADDGTVFLSTDNGESWTIVRPKSVSEKNKPPAAIVQMRCTDRGIWVLLSDGKIYRRLLSEMIPQGVAISTTLNQIDAAKFPQIKTLVTVNDASGLPVAGLSSANFTVKENSTVESPLTVVPAGSSGSPVMVMIALDKGETMTTAMLSRAKTYASNFVQMLAPGDSAAILPFDDQVVVRVPFTSNQGLLLEGIHGITGSKASSIYDALYASVQRLKNRTGSKAILLMSAGIDQTSQRAPEEIIQLLATSGIPVYVIGFPAGARGEETLTRIAKSSNGAFYVELGTEGLAGIYDAVAMALKNQYQVSYTSHNTAADGTLRTVAVTTSYNGGTGTQQKQYTAPTLTTAPSMMPTSAALVPSGQPFWVEVKVGDPNTVKDLYGISFKLRSSLTSCIYVSGSATAGSFLTTGPLTFFQSPDAQTVSATVTKTAAPGVSGSGIVARFQFATPSSVTTTTSVTFTLSDVQANTSAGASIPMSLGSLTISVSPSVSIWPGDCDNNGTANAADVLPIGLYYGQKNGTTATTNNPGIQWQAYKRLFWLNDSLGRKVYADADGNGVIDGADVLAVGLNYGKAVVNIGSNVLGKSSAGVQADGSLDITSVMRGGSRRRVLVPVILSTTAPVYGIAFTLSTGGSATFVSVDSARNPLSNPLMLLKPSDDLSQVDIGMTSTRGRGFIGRGKLLMIELDLTDDASSSISCDLVNVRANDANGVPINIADKSYRGVVSEIVQDPLVPIEYGLSQNYPNPFNPSTNIELRIVNAGFVSLKVFDVLGRVVATLVNEERGAGIYNERWDASAMTSGVYYYRMMATDKSGTVFTQTRRMTLVK